MIDLDSYNYSFSSVLLWFNLADSSAPHSHPLTPLPPQWDGGFIVEEKKSKAFELR